MDVPGTQWALLFLPPHITMLPFKHQLGFPATLYYILLSTGTPMPLLPTSLEALSVPLPTGVSEWKAAGPHLQFPGQPGHWAVLRQLPV